MKQDRTFIDNHFPPSLPLRHVGLHRFFYPEMTRCPPLFPLRHSGLHPLFYPKMTRYPPSFPDIIVSFLAVHLILVLTAGSTFLFLFSPTLLSERSSLEEIRQYADDASDIQQARERTKLVHQRIGVCDLANPQDGLQSCLDGLTTVLGVDLGRNRLKMASPPPAEATWSNKQRTVTRETRKNCPDVGKYRY